MNIIRLFSTSLKSVSNSELAQLRRRTGFSVVNCRNALKLNNNDVGKAEEWLKKEAKRLGWEKAAKLDNRTACEGLVAVAQKDNKLVMAEINCETDFVARNEKFVSLCQVVAKACLLHPVGQLHKNTKKILLSNELINLETPEKEKLSDYIVKKIGEFGEKIVLKRALFYEADNNIQINFAVHPPISDGKEIFTGKYGAFVAYQKSQGSMKDDPDLYRNLGMNLCKHIIGSNPTKVGSSEDLLSKVSSNELGADSSRSEDNVDTEDMDSSDLTSEDDGVLICQDFLMCPQKTVGEILSEHKVEVVDFHRFHCGEDIETSTESCDNQERHIEGNIKTTRAKGI